MPKAHKPRSGSMQNWPRKRSKKILARVRSWPSVSDVSLLGFAGYKVGMTHIGVTDSRPNSMTKNKEIFMPVTIIECPPIKVAAVRFYKQTNKGLNPITEIFTDKLDKELKRKITAPKNIKKKIDDIKPEDFDDIRILVYTQPKLTSIGKKKPELFETAIGGKKEEKLSYAKENLGKEIPIDAILRPGQQIDVHAVTKGKGFQGAVKRFGIGLKEHKSEKSIRTPGSLGGWKSQGHVMYRISHAGQTGFHTRTEYNKWIINISKDPKEINIKGGFLRYGIIKNPFILVKGSVHGPSKRTLRLVYAIRPNKKIPAEPLKINYTSLESQQGR